MNAKTIDLENLPSTKKALRGILKSLGLTKADWKGLNVEKLQTLVTDTVNAEQALEDDADDAGVPADTDNAYNAEEVRALTMKGSTKAAVLSACKALGITDPGKNVTSARSKLAALLDGIEGDPNGSLERLVETLRTGGAFLPALVIEVALANLDQIDTGSEGEDDAEDSEDEDTPELSKRAKAASKYLRKNGFERVDDEPGDLHNGDNGIVWDGEGWRVLGNDASDPEDDIAHLDDLTGKKLLAAFNEALESDEDEDEDDAATNALLTWLDPVADLTDEDALEIAKDLGVYKGKSAKVARKKLQKLIDDEDSDWTALQTQAEGEGWDFMDGDDSEDDEEEDEDEEEEEDDEEEEEAQESVTLHFWTLKDEDGDTFYCLHGGKKLATIHSDLKAGALRKAGFDFDDADDNCWYVEKAEWKQTKENLAENTGLDITWRSKKQSK